jgi:sulfur carrier protein
VGTPLGALAHTSIDAPGGVGVRVTVNGAERGVAEGATVAELAALVGVAPSEAGTAVAVDGRVVPRREWDETAVEEGARVEVVRAAAGG